MNEDEVQICVDALWGNAIDGRLADREFGSDFDAAEAELRRSFEAFLSGALT